MYIPNARIYIYIPNARIYIYSECTYPLKLNNAYAQNKICKENKFYEICIFPFFENKIRYLLLTYF